MRIRVLIRRSAIVTVTSALAGIIFSSCNASLLSVSYDDVYSDSDDEEYLQPEPVKKEKSLAYQDPAYKKKTESYREAVNANTAANNQSEIDNSQDASTEEYSQFDEDDYYDYAYSARIRRFYGPVIYSDYYADYYTNMYWYTHDPLYWGTSIYLGYSWWYPSFYARWSDPFYWSWYSPYYYSHWYGPHHHHHWSCYHHHHDVCYFNSHDHNSNLYRGTSTGTGYIRRNTGGISRAGYVESNKLARGLNTSSSSISRTNGISRRSTIGSTGGNTISKPGINRSGNLSANSNTLRKPSRLTKGTTAGTIGRSTASKPNKVSSKPGITRRSAGTYTPPSTRRQTTPSSATINRNMNRSRNTSTSFRRNSERTTNRNISRPSRSNRTISTPSRSTSGSRSISSPSRSSSRSIGSHGGGGRSIRR